MIKGVYFDGKTSHSKQCSVHITDEFIHVYFYHDENKSIIWSKSNIKTIDFNGDLLIIKYGEFPSQTIEITGIKANEVFLSLKNNTLQKTKSYWFKNKGKSAILLCFIFIIFCVFSYFIVLPWIGEKSIVFIPKETEIELGNNIAESIIQTNTEIDSATFYSNKFIEQLKISKKYPIHISVIKSEEINAFALPGGKIFVYSGILKNMNTYEEFAALLGHEMAHVTHQHSLKSIGRSISSSFFISMVFGDVSGIASGILDQANQFKQLNYSRELETQADNEGFNFLLKNQISPKGMLNLLIHLQKESNEDEGMMKYFSTHPETNERIKNIKNKNNCKRKFIQNLELKQLFEKLKNQLK
jgi:predicted Zn-dependent protease